MKSQNWVTWKSALFVVRVKQWTRFIMPAVFIESNELPSKRVHLRQTSIVQLVHCMRLGFGRLCSKKKLIMLLAVLIFFRNYAKIMLLSENYALCHRSYATWILRKIKIASSLTLSILTLMNIQTVHLPVLQSSAWQIRMCAPRKAKWYPNQPFLGSESGSESYLYILVLDAIQAKPSV